MPTRPLPRTGSVHLDARGDGRALRVAWHEDAGLVVLSLWRENVCQGTFRLAPEELPTLIETLAHSLARAEAARPARPEQIYGSA